MNKNVKRGINVNQWRDNQEVILWFNEIKKIRKRAPSLTSKLWISIRLF